MPSRVELRPEKVLLCSLMEPAKLSVRACRMISTASVPAICPLEIIS